MRTSPPRLARALLARVLPRDVAEFVIGDLEEMHARRAKSRGRVHADLWYWRTALSAVGARGGRTPASWGGVMLDARAAARSLRRTPGFTAVASGTLAVGLGATIAVYAMADQLLLRTPAGVHGGERAIYIEFASDDGATTYLSPADVDDLRAAASGVVEQVTAVATTRAHVAMDAADPTSAEVAFVDGPLFELLGVRALRGRLPRGAELAIASPPTVAVIGERLWTTLRGGADEVIGATLRVNGQPVEIVAVADAFAGLDRSTPVDVWLPSSALVPVLEFDRERLVQRRASLFPYVLARLRDGVDTTTAAAGVRAAVARIVASLPAGESTIDERTPRVHEGINALPGARTQIRESLRLLAIVVALVLVVACANVANLLLFRALRERREVAVRRALGASRARVVVQQMIGNGMLTATALGAAVIVAWMITRLFAGRTLLGLPAFGALAVDGGLLLFAGAAALFAALLAGAVPAWVAARSGSLSAGHIENARSTGRHEVLRRGMTVVQLTASLGLIVAALLLVRTVRTLYAIDPGYPTAGLHVVSLEAPVTWDMPTRLAAFARAEAAAAAVPGVRGTALDVGGPLVSRLRGPVARTTADRADRTFGIVTFITPEWFDLMEVRIVRGRAFAAEDRGAAGASRVLLSEGLARTLFENRDPVGRTIHAFGRNHDVEVIGVVEDIRYANLLREPEPVVYHPWVDPLLVATTVLLYRDAQGASPDVRAALMRAVPELAIGMPVPLADRIDAQLADHRLFAQLLGLLSLLAGVLAGVGLYAVVAYGVADRTREFGIRMALGARAAGIVGLVLRQTAATVAIGMVFGVAAAIALSRGLAARLDEVQPLDPVVYLVAILTLCGVAALACLAPVHSATRVDPMAVLREE